MGAGRIRRLLIANRGEIVVRVARTARALGIETVAVVSDSDMSAPHALACDRVIRIGGETPAESYLQAERILDAARSSGADAIHPGYGFLSENADFADAVEAAGLIWVGPPGHAIRSMGDKSRARIRAVAAGLPVTPGYDGEDQSQARMMAEAETIGFPIMVKASAGGGGRGMRLVAAAKDLPAALSSANSEAAKAFGDGRLLLEMAIVAPRHVEVQIFADARGNAVHLFERDCSVQRRHQKVIEEAPSPAVSESLRAEMGEAAVAIARDIGYRGAGTVEFLLDRSGRFYFMEMNTRLQVEHPVTELITGLDLVEWQLRVAQGEALPLTQDQIKLDGWAIEARLCAEDPVEDYGPRTGTVLAWRPSAGARTDHAVAQGQLVSPFFDSMLGKIIVRGADRNEACERLRAALDDTVLIGVPTNRALLGRIAGDAVFVEGQAVSTAFLTERFGEPEQRAPVPDETVWAIGAWLSVSAEADRWNTPVGWRDWSNSTSHQAPWRMRIEREDEADERRGTVVTYPGGARVAIGDGHVDLSGELGIVGEPFVVAAGQSRYEVVYGWLEEELWVRARALAPADAEAIDVRFVSLRRAPPEGTGSANSDTAIVAPMNGRVVAMAATVDAIVAAGEVLAVVEAMKMEHSLTAAVASRVIAIHASVGDQVAPRQLLVELEPVSPE